MVARSHISRYPPPDGLPVVPGPGAGPKGAAVIRGCRDGFRILPRNFGRAGHHEIDDPAYDQAEDRLAYTPPRLRYGGHNLKIVATDSGENTTIHQNGIRVLRPR